MAAVAGIEHGKRRLHHRPEPNALRQPRLAEPSCPGHDVVRAPNLGNEDGIRLRAAERGEVGGAPRRVEGIDAHHELTPTITPGSNRRRDLGPGDLLGLGRDRVFEIEDERIGGKRPCLLQRPRIRAWEVKEAAAQPDHGCVSTLRQSDPGLLSGH